MTFNFNLDKLLGALKLCLEFTVIVLVASALFLWDPISLFGGMWLPRAPTLIRAGAFIAFAIGIGNPLIFGFRLFGVIVQEVSERITIRKRLGQLTPDEKVVLQRFIAGNTLIVMLPYFSGTSSALRDAGILHLTGTQIMIPHNVTWAIDEQAWRRLHKKPELLNLSDEEQKQVDPRRISGIPF